MDATSYDPRKAEPLNADTYTDFLFEGGKLWPLIKALAEEVGLLNNLRTIDKAARAACIQVMIVPHRRLQSIDYQGWSHPNPSQLGLMKLRVFARGGWGGDWHPAFAPRERDVVIAEHWAQSGLANTDLDLQLKQRDTSDVILVGLLANTCIESTGRFAMELGYRVTLVRDATAASKRAMMHAAHELNGATFAHSIVTTSELVQALPRRLLSACGTLRLHPKPTRSVP